MPNVIGLLLQDAEAYLERAGVVSLATIGYFGEWPIHVKWMGVTDLLGNCTAQGQLSIAGLSIAGCWVAGRYIAVNAPGGLASKPFIVVGQSVPAGDSVVANSIFTLNVVEPPMGVAYPG